jgi:hypothetical protein
MVVPTKGGQFQRCSANDQGIVAWQFDTKFKVFDRKGECVDDIVNLVSVK